MDVRLLSYTFKPEDIIYLAGRICYHSGPLIRLYEELADRMTVENFIKRLIKNNHLSPLEHAKATFYIGDISLVCLNQLVRHRLASYNVRSFRYTEHNDNHITIPLTVLQKLHKDTELKQEIEDYLTKGKTIYNKLLNIGIPKEDARYFIPQGYTTRLIMTANFREWRHIIKLRTDKRAHWEVRELLTDILYNLIGIAPSCFTDLLPKQENKVDIIINKEEGNQNETTN